MTNTNYSNLTNDQLYIQYQEAKVNFRNAIEGTQEEIEADRIFTELSKEIENREAFDWLSYKLAETENKKQTELNNELLQGLINQIESLEDGGIINLVDLIEDEGAETTSELLMYLYDSTKHLNIKAHETVNNIPKSIKVLSK